LGVEDAGPRTLHKKKKFRTGSLSLKGESGKKMEGLGEGRNYNNPNTTGAFPKEKPLLTEKGEMLGNPYGARRGTIGA